MRDQFTRSAQGIKYAKTFGAVLISLQSSENFLVNVYPYHLQPDVFYLFINIRYMEQHQQIRTQNQHLLRF